MMYTVINQTVVNIRSYGSLVAIQFAIGVGGIYHCSYETRDTYKRTSVASNFTVVHGKGVNVRE